MTRNRGTEGPSQGRPHEEFLELCALSTSGELTEDEQKNLREHLAICAECREALEEFEAAAVIGVPLLLSELSPTASSHIFPASGEITVPSASTNSPGEGDTGRTLPAMENQFDELALSHRNDQRRTQVNWNYVWMPFAACLVLMAALAVYSYHTGKQRGIEVAQIVPSSAVPQADAIEQQMSDAEHDREVLMTQLSERDRVIRDLQSEIDQKSASLDELKTDEANLERSIQDGDAEKQHVAQERGTLAQKLDEAQESAAKTQADLDSLRHDRSQEQVRMASLEQKINDLSAQLRDRQEMIARQEELLGHDRDIRELMGARDLYIAEVYDVARDGATQKPYGRVFYTKGKSLIFYAYDLDQQAGIKNASTFQAWGRRGPDRQQALNLGVFYEDSEAKKRWVLKFDDSKMLQQIDAVFVTVEPNGGSHKPSGKPLLFAYLKLDPNHP